MSFFEINPICRYIIAGQLTRDYLILPNGTIKEDIPGGAGLSGCLGLSIWDNGINLLGRVSSDYPPAWLSQLTRFGINVQAVQTADQCFHQENFQAFNDWEGNASENPIKEYGNRKMPVPSVLIDQIKDHYLGNRQNNISKNAVIQLNEIPAYLADASNLLLLKMDWKNQALLLDYFHQQNLPHTAFFPAVEWMVPGGLTNLQKYCRNVESLFTIQPDLENLFPGTTHDIWEMMAGISDCYCESIVVLNGLSGVLLYNKSDNKRYSLPVYPFTRKMNPVGYQAAFMGGFTAGKRLTYDPVEAILYGSVSASIMLEGMTPFAAMDVLAGLKAVRLRAMRSLVKKM